MEDCDVDADVDVRDPDEKSIMTYVAQFLQYSRDLPVADEEMQVCITLLLSRHNVCREVIGCSLVHLFLKKGKKMTHFISGLVPVHTDFFSNKPRRVNMKLYRLTGHPLIGMFL